MARIRSIKPEFWSSEQVMECSLNARLLFIGLWNFCDDAGRHPLAHRQIKALVFPGDDLSTSDIKRMFDELSTNGLIETYTIDGKEYFQVTGWRHQKIDRPQSAKYPAPLTEHSTNVRDGKDEGEEGKGKESSEANASGADAPPVDLEKKLFERGKQVLGKTAGGVISRLKAHCQHNLADALAVVEQAAAKQSPMEWVQGVLRKIPDEPDPYRNVDCSPLTAEQLAYARVNGLS